MFILIEILSNLPCPGGVMYVLRIFAKTSPSRTIPTPILLAEPSNPIEITIFVGKTYYYLV